MLQAIISLLEYLYIDIYKFLLFLLTCVKLTNFPGRDCTNNGKKETKEAEHGEWWSFRVRRENVENTEDFAGVEMKTHC